MPDDRLEGEGVILRDYQRDALAAVARAWETDTATLVVMATGMGKTVLASGIIEQRLRDRTNGKALFIAHRRELVNQTAATLRSYCPDMRIGVEMADRKAMLRGLYPDDIVVASQQTLSHSNRRRWFKPEEFGTVVFDEAHHTLAASWVKIRDHFAVNPECRFLGLTATPDRLDGLGLGHVFDSCAYRMDLRAGVDDGWLCRPKIQMIPVRDIDISDVKILAGELHQGQLSAELERDQAVICMTDPLLKLTKDGRRTIIFATSVKQSHMIAAHINAMKPDAAVVVSADTDKEQRDRYMDEFGRGHRQYLVNVDIATEGWDDPCKDAQGVQCVAMMRMTASRAKYVQMIGRGARPLRGLVDGTDCPEQRKAMIAASAKPHFSVIDFVGITGKHQIVTAADVLAGEEPPEVVAKAKRIMEQEKSAITVEEAIEKAKSRLEQEQEEKEERIRNLRKVQQVKVEYDIIERDPWKWAASISTFALPDQKTRPATKAQVERIKRYREDVPRSLSFAEASALIDVFKDRPTKKQAFWLRKFGFDPAKVTAAQARGILTKKWGR